MLCGVVELRYVFLCWVCLTQAEWRVRPSLQACFNSPLEITDLNHRSALAYYRACKDLGLTSPNVIPRVYMKKLSKNLKRANEDFLHETSIPMGQLFKIERDVNDLFEEMVLLAKSKKKKKKKARKVAGIVRQEFTCPPEGVDSCATMFEEGEGEETESAPPTDPDKHKKTTSHRTRRTTAGSEQADRPTQETTTHIAIKDKILHPHWPTKNATRRSTTEEGWRRKEEPDEDRTSRPERVVSCPIPTYFGIISLLSLLTFLISLLIWCYVVRIHRKLDMFTVYEDETMSLASSNKGKRHHGATD